MKNLRIGVRLVSGFLIVSLLPLAIGLISLSSTNKLEQDLNTVGHLSLPYAANLGAVKAELMNIRAIQRALLNKDLSEE